MQGSAICYKSHWCTSQSSSPASSGRAPYRNPTLLSSSAKIGTHQHLHWLHARLQHLHGAEKHALEMAAARDGGNSDDPDMKSTRDCRRDKFTENYQWPQQLTSSHCQLRPSGSDLPCGRRPPAIGRHNRIQSLHPVKPLRYAIKGTNPAPPTCRTIKA